MENAACGRTPAWPNNDARPELRTLRGRLLRFVPLSLLYGLWAVGLLFFIGMYAYSAVCVLQSLYSALFDRGTALTPLPLAVKLLLAATALYESYHYVTRDSRHSWPFFRHLVRDSLTHYPYFRLNVCVFEERELEKLQQKQKQLQLERVSRDDSDGSLTASSASDEEESDRSRGVRLPAAAASKAVEENDLTPFVKPNERALFAFHPHGELTNGWAFNGAHHRGYELADCRWLVAENLFWFPFVRDLLHWMDQGSVAKSSFQQVMHSGQNVCVLPGGFEDATLYARGKHRVYLKKRFGFIKLALQYGYKVHPAYTFGEELAYHSFSYWLPFRLWLNTLRVPAAIFFGLPYCFYMPRSDVDLITVVGKALELPHIANPTKEEVKKYHDQYVQALQDLFDHYKGVYAVDPNATLEIY